MKKNNKTKKIIVASVALAGVLAAGFYVVNNSNKNPNDTIVAQIDGKPVYISEVNAKINDITNGAGDVDFQALDEKAKYVVVQELAAHKIILKEAYKKGMDSKEAVKDQLASYKDKLVKKQFLSEAARAAVTEEKIKQRYEELAKDLESKTRFKVRHILVETKSQAKKIVRRLKKESFENLAKLESIDTKTAQDGGDLGYLFSGSMTEEFDNAVTKLKVGKTSKPFETSYGWHIVKLDEKEDAQAASYDEVKKSIAQNLLSEAVQEKVKSLLDKVEIEVISSQEEKAEEKAEDESAG